jgi:hypothetical protein
MFRVLIIALTLVTGCELNNNTTTGGDCTDHSQCGEMQACIEFACTDVECLASSDCALHNYCDKDDDKFLCTEGCESDEDCIAGEKCNVNNVCEEYGCRSTELDCPVGHVCNEASGDCQAINGLCNETCDVYDTWGGCSGNNTCEVSDWGDECNADRDCDQGFNCDMFLASHDECETNNDCPDDSECYGAVPGWLPGQCVVSICHKDYCMPNCNVNNPMCPAGFSCEQGGTGGVCWGACGWYVENGYL